MSSTGPKSREVQLCRVICGPVSTPAANQSYALRLVRVIANTDANLLGLALQAPDGNVVPLSADFAPATTRYSAEVPLNTNFVTVWASGASVSILPPDDDAGRPGHQLRFRPGQSRRIDVAVTAGNGTTMKSYRIDATRPEIDVCQRTAAVRDAIVGALAGVDDCTDVSAAQLRGIRKVPVGEDDDLVAPTFRRGDFAGMSGLEILQLVAKSAETLPVGLFDGLTGLKRLEILNADELTRLPRSLFAGLSSLESLDIWFNPKLSTLPVGLFDGLARLNRLQIAQNPSLAGLPPGLFRNLSALTELWMVQTQGYAFTLPAGIFDDLEALQVLVYSGEATEIPAGMFDGLGRLESLHIEGSGLDTLPPGIFDRLGRLDQLSLKKNNLTALQDGVFGKLTLVRYLDVEFNPGVDTFVPVADAGGDLQAEPGAAVTLAGNATGPWDANVLWSWEQVDSGGNALMQSTVTLAGADTPAPSFSAPDAPATLHFKVTVTGRGTIHEDVEPITGTDTVTVRVGPAVTDTLAALALADPDGVALALSPQFSASTLAYSAAAPPGADRVTLMARPAHPAARVSFGPEADAAPAPGHQAALGAPGSVTRVTATAVSDSGGESMVYGVDVKRAETDVCRRTGAVRDAIVAAVAGVSDCADLTPAQLARIGVLDVSNRKVPALAAGDFAGLAGLTRLDLGNPGNDRGPMQSLPAGIFDGLAALTALDLSGNALAALPPGLFDRLTGLTALRLADNALTELPGGVFNRLTALTALDLSGNGLAALPPGLFDRLTGLTELRLAGNALAGLPAGVFDRLTALTALDLSGNGLAALRPGLFDRLTGLTELHLAGNALAALPDVIFERLTALRKFSIANNPGAAAFLPKADAGPDRAVAAGTAGMTLDGSTSGAGPWGAGHWGANVLYSWTQAGGVSVTLSDANTAQPSFTAPAAAAELTFALTVRPRGGTAGGVTDFSNTAYGDSDGVSVTVQAAAAAAADVRLAALSLAAPDRDSIALLDWTTSNPTDFAPGTTQYRALLPATVASVAVRAAAWNLAASLTIDPADADSDPANGHQVAFNPGQTRSIVVRVTSADGNTEAAWTVSAQRTQQAQPLPDVCERTPGVRDAIVAAISGVDDCADVTATHLAGIGRLDLSGRSVAGLRAGDFAGLSGMTHLDFFQATNLTALPPGVFAGLGALRQLSVDGQGLTALAPGVFAGLGSLRALRLERNRLTALAPGIFDGLGSLGILQLYDNHLTALPPGVFAGLGSLRELLLYDNRLTALAPGVFAGLGSLEDLRLQNNRLTALPPGVFDGLGSLKDLELFYNRLTALPPGVFAGLGSLTGLWLQDNRLTALPPGVFDGLGSLSSLRLNGNDLTALPPGVFETLTALTALRLSGNPGSAVFLPGAAAGPDLRAAAGAAFALAGATGADNPWGANVTYGWTQSGGTATALSDAARPDPVATAPATDEDLFFSLKVAGRGGTFESFDDVRVRVRTPGTEAALASLAFLAADGAPVRLLPGFSREATSYSYSAWMAPDSGTLTVAAAAADPLATVAINPASDADLTAHGHQVRLAAGSVGDVVVTVISGDGQAERSYTVTVRHPATDLCGRTPAVRDAVVATVEGVTACEHVTPAHLAGVQSLRLNSREIAALKAGDFAGLTRMTQLALQDNELAALPRDLFAGLGALQTLTLADNVLTMLPADLFAGLGALRSLTLADNALASLPDGIFERLTALGTLTLSGNPGSAGFLPAAAAGADRMVAVGAAVALDGRASRAAGPWRGNVVAWNWEQTDSGGTPLQNPTLMPAGADTPTPTFTAPAAAGDMYFRLTVTGRGTGGTPEAPVHYRASDTVTVTVTAPAAMGDARLARLTVSHGAPAAPVALTPPFSSDVTGYRGAPDNAVARVTVDYATRQAGATVVVEDGSGAALADADADAPGHQVDLAPGENSVRIAVTAPNGTDRADYTLRLTRRLAARLEALSITDPEGRPLALAPPFAPDILRYRAPAPHAATRVTVRAAGADGALATVSPPDADAGAAGHQAALGEPGTTATLTLMVAGGAPDQAYTVEVLRPATDLCERTGAVRAGLLAALRSLDSAVYDGPSAAGVSGCAQVTAAQLAGVRTLDLADEGIAGLVAGDFAGLAGLAVLDLEGNALKSLPPGLFAGLAGLTELKLRTNRLTLLSRGAFAGLAALTEIDLARNALPALPAGLFDGQPGLVLLDLWNNGLTALPAGIFERLPALETLGLSGNPGAATFKPFLSAPAPSHILPSAAVALDARQSLIQGPWKSNVTWEWVQTDAAGVTLVTPTLTLAGADTATPSFTAPAAVGTQLHIRVKVTGRGSAPGSLYTAEQRLALEVGNVLGLRSLAVSGPDGTVDLAPLFSAGHMEYRAALGAAAARVTLQARATSGATVAFLDADELALADADADAADQQVDLEPGTNTVKVRVTDSNAMTATYTLILIRAPPLDLTALALADGAGNAIALDPAFATATREYTARVAHGVEFATVRASAHGVARVEVTPADAGALARGHQVRLHPGEARAITVTVSHGQQREAWTVRVKRPATDVCERTPAVRDAIVAAVSGVSDCVDLTAAQLAGIGVLDVSNNQVATLQAGDFGGLTALTNLDLSDNALSALPPGLFDRLTGLTVLRLADNALSELPGRIFANLTALRELSLDGNPGRAGFLPVAEAGEAQTVPGGTRASLSGSATGPWGRNVGWAWTQSAGETVTLAGADTAAPSFTAPRGGGELSFRLTVTGRGAASTGNDNRFMASATVTVTVRDLEAPSLAAAAADGMSTVLIFSEALDATSVPPSGAFAVTLDGARAALASTDPVAVAGAEVTLTLAATATAGQSVRVSYTVPRGSNASPLRDPTGNEAAGFLRRSVVNRTGDITAPGLVSAENARTVEGDMLSLVYDEALDPQSVPPAGAFAVRVNSADATLDSGRPVSVSGNAVTLRLARATDVGDRVTVAYTAPTGTGATPVRDLAGNAAGGFAAMSVQQPQPRRAAARADGVRGGGGGYAGAPDLGGAGAQWRLGPQRLPHPPWGGRGGAGGHDLDRCGHDLRDDGDRARQRHGLHVRGAGGERRRAGDACGAVGDAAGVCLRRAGPRGPAHEVDRRAHPGGDRFRRPDRGLRLSGHGRFALRHELHGRNEQLRHRRRVPGRRRGASKPPGVQPDLGACRGGQGGAAPARLRCGVRALRRDGPRRLTRLQVDVFHDGRLVADRHADAASHHGRQPAGDRGAGDRGGGPGGPDPDGLRRHGGRP